MRVAAAHYYMGGKRTMRRNPEFTRRFNQVTEGETQTATALRIGVTPSYVGQIKRGAYIPSRDVLERFIEEYRLDREVWLQLAGFTRKAPQADTSIQEAVDQAVQRVAAAVNGAQRFAHGLFELSRRYGRPVPVYLQHGAETLTVEEADRLLAEFERQMRAEQDSAAAATSAAQPLRLEPPTRGKTR